MGNVEMKMVEGLKYCPMLVGRNSLGEGLVAGGFNDFWEVFDALSEDIKDTLTAPEMSRRIEMLQKERGLSDDHIEIVSAIIREYFLGKKDALWLENALVAKLDQKDVAFVKEYIQKNILTIKPTPKMSEKEDEIPTVQTVSLPLLDALSKYQRLSEQTVTEDRIAVKGESQPVRGSIRNWLRNYRDSVGIRKHSTVERGQFLFQSDNTKRLSAAEREKLSLILRSLDENIPVSIDVERQEIVFPAVEEKESIQSPPPAERAIPSLETSFRPLEKFPAQAAPIQKVLEWNAKTQSTEPSQRENAPVSNQEAKNTKAAPFENKAFSASVPPVRAVGVSTPVYGVPTHDQVLEAPFASKGNISFSSSHVLPHEKADEKTVENPQKKQESARSTPEPVSRGPEAISIIKPRGNAFGFRRDVSGSSGSAAGGGFDAPRVVNLRSSGGIRQDKTGA